MADLLETLYKTWWWKPAGKQVSIGGQLVTPRSSEISYAIAQVPTCNLEFDNPPPASATFFSNVAVDLGIGGVVQRAFTGIVVNVNPTERGCVVECQGKSWALEQHYHKIVITLNSVTAQAAITQLLNDAGITDYVVNMPAWTIGTRVPQTLEFQTYSEAITKIAEVDGGRWYELPTGTIRVEPRDPIPSTTAWRVYFSGVLTGMVSANPPALPVATYGNPRLRRIGTTQDVRQCKNQVFVQGATYQQTNPDGTESPIDVVAEAKAPSPWIRKPDGSQAYSDALFSNELIDTEVKAAQVAGRLVTLYNRLLTRLSPEIEADAQVMLARTVEIEDPSYSAVTGNWFVEGYRTRLDQRTYSTNLDLLGGQGAGGTMNISPFALFTYKVDLEVMGDRQWAIVTLDATASFDPDGTIVSYVWSSDIVPDPFAGKTGKIVTVAVDPSLLSGTTFNATLVVTDNVGATDTLTITVTIQEGSTDVVVPAMFVAAGPFFSASPDGGITWNDQAVPGGDSAISVHARLVGNPFGIAIFGTQGGSLYRSTDYCATVPTLVQAAVGSPFVSIANSALVPDEFWALTQNCRLYRSIDQGVTWALHDNLDIIVWPHGAGYLGPPAGAPTMNGIGGKVLTPEEGGVWVLGGDGLGMPLICWDASRDHNWIKAAIGGELLADLSSPPADLYVRDWNLGIKTARSPDGSTKGSSFIILLNSSSHTPAVYSTENIFSADGSEWKRAVGAPAKSHGQWMDGEASLLGIDLCQFGFDDNTVYLGTIPLTAGGAPSGGAVNVSVAAAVLDAGEKGYHGLPIGMVIGGIYGCHFVAAHDGANGTIYKTWDRFTTIGKARPATGFPAAPAGWRAWHISIAAAGASSPPIVQDRLAAVGKDVSPRQVSWLLLPNPTWHAAVAVAGLTTSDPRVYPVTDQVWFTTSATQADTGPTWGSGYRTSDGGLTWAATPSAGYGHYTYARDAGGRIWLAAHEWTGSQGHTHIYYSDDNGVSWHLSTSIGGASSTANGWCIAPHPSNQNVIAIALHMANMPSAGWHAGILYTADRGATWTRYDGDAITKGQLNVADQYDLVMLPSGRLVTIGPFNAATGYYVYVSDDKGVNWSEKWHVSLTHHKVYGLFASADGARIGFIYSNTDDTPDSHHLILSTDGGNNFAYQPLGTELETFLGSDVGLSAFTMSRMMDALYLSTGAAKKVVRLKPVSSDGVWADLTDAYPFTLWGNDNLGAIPVP